MKIILAFDSFKGSLSAVQACAAAAEGLARLSPAPQVVSCPLSDGGEGFAETLRLAAHGERLLAPVTGPLFTPVIAELTLLDDGYTAVIEAAQACGLHLMPRGQRNPLHTTTRGVGEMLIAASNAGATRMIVGLGGSATNDGGMGMLDALAWRFFDEQGRMLLPQGDALASVRHIAAPSSTLQGLDITVACDVTNPLFGPQGAAYTFAPQKGASPAEVALLDDGLRNYAEICTAFLGTDFSTVPGGAAGGLGFALLAFLHAQYRSGAEIAIGLSGLEAQLRNADLCLTGEGCTDAQTAYGKLPAAVAACCRQAGVPCVCLSGALGDGWRQLYASGFTALFSLSQRPQSLKKALSETPTALADAAEAVARVCGMNT